MTTNKVEKKLKITMLRDSVAGLEAEIRRNKIARTQFGGGRYD